MNRWRWLWLAWLLLFFLIELPAIFNDTPDDTLSEQVWALLSLGSFFVFVIGAFLIWLVYHFMLEPWINRRRDG